MLQYLSCNNFMEGNIVQKWIWSSAMHRSIKENSNKIYFIISWVLLYFYTFLKFIWIFRIIKEIENQNPIAQC
jgi:hypothetical protein